MTSNQTRAAAALGLFAIALWALWPSESMPPTAQVEAVAKQPDTGRLAKLEDKIAQLESRRSGETSAPKTTVHSTAIEEADDAEVAEEEISEVFSHEDALANEHRAVGKVVSSLVGVLEQEAVDTGWAEEAEISIAELLQDETFATLELTHVECKTSLCRVDVDILAAEGDAEERIGKLTEVGMFRYGGFADFSEPAAVAMFIAREGYNLPPPPE